MACIEMVRSIVALLLSSILPLLGILVKLTVSRIKNKASKIMAIMPFSFRSISNNESIPPIMTENNAARLVRCIAITLHAFS